MSGLFSKETRDEWAAKATMWMAARSSRNTTFVDRLCRRLLNRVTTRPPETDFMRDPLIDNDQGFDPDELDRYQRGES